MNGEEFITTLLSDFPDLAAKVQESEGLLHVQMWAFSSRTQAAIDSGDMPTLDRCFALAHRAFRDADAALKNAFYVSYLEHLDFAGIRGTTAQRRMTPLLRDGYTEIMDYMKQLAESSKRRTK